MRRFLIPTLVLALAVTGFAPTVLAQKRGGGQGRGGSGGPGAGGCGAVFTDHLASLPSEQISAAERDAMSYMREEEKLARDVYATLALTWDIPVFERIARAEQRHMDHMAELLARNGVPDPVTDDTIGAFTDPELGALYASLTATGRSSLEQALEVGATIEDLDLADLAAMLDDSDNLDIAFVGNNLAKGSRNHLRAFSRALEMNGFPAHTAQHLTQGEVDAILAAGHERGVIYDEYGDVLMSTGGGRRGNGPGNGACDGTGPGRGRGRGQGRGQGPGTGTCPRVS